MFILTAAILTNVFSFSAASEKPVKSTYELDRDRDLEENVVRLRSLMQQKFGPRGADQEGFTDFARSLVFGGAQRGTSTTQDKEIEEDPAYEPNPEDIANAEDDLVADDEDRNVRKTSSQVCPTIYGIAYDRITC